MAFPPALDRAWDETFPPDTQAANLLGLDIRNLKTDIRERMMICGTLANRPSNMDAVYGSGGIGIIYFATDNGQAYRWNGVAWVTVFVGTAKFLDTVQSIFVPGAGGVVNTITIPGGVLQPGALIRCKFLVSRTDTANTQINAPFFQINGHTPPVVSSIVSLGQKGTVVGNIEISVIDATTYNLFGVLHYLVQGGQSGIITMYAEQNGAVLNTANPTILNSNVTAQATISWAGQGLNVTVE